jgi:uncharacterized membrane protein YccC
MKYSTMVITDETQVPAGYVRISELTSDKNAASAISKLHGEGLVPAVKLMRTAKDHSGPVWVDRDIALRSIRATVSTRVRQDIRTMFDAPPQPDALDRVERLLERIANSLDMIADAATRVATTNEAKDAAQSYE